MDATAMSADEWNKIPWKEIEVSVHKLQKRIYRASKSGKVVQVRKLQRLLVSSWSAKCLAVRRVTQDNQGKKTAGVDGVKSLTPRQRLELVKNLKIGCKAAPVRRVWIPKPGKDEKRPLGIPTMRDRATQTLVKLALEPEWEAKFEPNSYGFRPGRSCWDAIEQIHACINRKPKWVLDADIAKCFDRINHQALLEKVNTFPKLRRQIRAWLKAGIMDGETLFPSEEGTPQGGAISPLLANIALHGLEKVAEKAYEYTGRKGIKYLINVIRYADDFVCLHESREVIEDCKKIISVWLASMGLELKPEKTRISHTLEKVEGKVGFDFLGFSIRQFRVGMKKSAKSSYKKPLGFKSIIQPSTQKQKQHSKELRIIIRNQRSNSQESLIAKLNPKIRGWSNYYHTVSSKETFVKRDHVLNRALWSWATHRHPKKGKKWIADKYWRYDEGKKSDFRPKGYDYGLFCHRDVKIKRHIKVIGRKSPFDGDWRYWSTRQGMFPGVSTQVATLLKKQRGRCQWCKTYFGEEDVMEVDHIIPQGYGGGNEYANKQLLHRHCHDTKSAKDIELYKNCPKVEKGKKRRWKKFSKFENWKSYDEILEDAFEVIRQFEQSPYNNNH